MVNEAPAGHRIEGRSSEDIRELQLEDHAIGPILRAKWKPGNSRPDTVQIKGEGIESRRLIQMWDQLLVKNGSLFRQFESNDGNTRHLQLVVPKTLREEVLLNLHAGAVGGHLGEDKTLSRLKERFYWPGHWTDNWNWCRTCATCATRKTASPETESTPPEYPVWFTHADGCHGPLWSSAGK